MITFIYLTHDRTAVNIFKQETERASAPLRSITLDQSVFSLSFSGGHVEVPPPAAGGEQEAGGAD